MVVIGVFTFLAFPWFTFLGSDMDLARKAQMAGVLLLFFSLPFVFLIGVVLVARNLRGRRSNESSASTGSMSFGTGGFLPWYFAPIAMLGLVVFAVLMLLGLQIIGTFRPDLRSGTYGELYAPRTWLPLFILICIVAMRVLIRSMVRRKRMGPSQQTGPTNSADSLMSVAIDTKWIAGALLVALLFGGLAIWASAWDPPTLAMFATDPDGNVYTVVGADLSRWNQKGQCTLKIDLDSVYKVKVFSDLAVDEQGTMAVSDSGAQKVLILDSTGRLVRTKSIGDPTANALREPDDSRIGLSFAGGRLHIVHDGVVTSIDSGTAEQVVLQDANSQWASGVWASGDTLVLSDTSNRRVFVKGPDKTTMLDCSKLEERYHYPDNVAMDRNGNLYVVIRKWWEDESNPLKSGSSEPEDPSREFPDTWMGELYVARKDAGKLVHVPLQSDGIPVPVDDFGFLPSGEVLVMPLSNQVLYAFDPRRPEAGVRPWARGELKKVLDYGDRCTKVKELAPFTFAIFAIMFPLVIGIGGALAAAGKTPPTRSTAMPAPRVVY